MSNSYKFIVVIPVGPNDHPDNILDTIKSVIYYTGTDRKIILADDTGGKDTCDFLQSQLPDIDVVKTPRNYGLHGGLYMTLSLAFLHAYKNYKFKVLFRLDTDALVIGERPEEDAIAFFAQHPNTGIIGHFGLGTKPDDINDGHWSKEQLVQESRRQALLRDPGLCLFLRRLLRRARANGFKLGDYIFGGSNFISPECIRKLAEANLLSRKELGRSDLEEDHIFSLLAKSVGLDLLDFAAGELPMAMEHKALPDAPEELLVRKKKVIHSVRRWKDLGEQEIRKYFREFRNVPAKV